MKHVLSENSILCVEKTINTRAAIDHFVDLMQDRSPVRLLFLGGKSKLGKTHLLSKVLSVIATQDYQAQKVMIDFFHKPTTVETILDVASIALGEEAFTNYLAAKSKRLEYPNATIAIERSLAVASKTTIVANIDSADTGIAQSWDSYITRQFINDLHQFCSSNSLVVFFVDNADRAEPPMQEWLINTFFMRLEQLARVRIVVTSIEALQPHLQYASSCKQHELSVIYDMEEYKRFCKFVYPHLVEQTIKVIADFAEYYPGLFVRRVEELRMRNVL